MSAVSSLSISHALRDVGKDVAAGAVALIAILTTFVLLLGKPSVDKPTDSGFCFASFGIVGTPARHFPKLLHDIDGWVQLAPAVVILRRHIEERLVIQNDADDRRRGDGYRLCARSI